MRRYWIESRDLNGEQVEFKDEVFHHIFSVCRQQSGSKFEVLTETSNAYLVEVTSVGKKTAIAKVLETRDIPALPEPHLHIALSISRFPVMDVIMEKAVEMGVKSIQPFFSEFSFVRQEEKISANKVERWEKIVRSATQQCGRGDLMVIEKVCPFDQLLTHINPNHSNRGLFAYEGASTHGIRSYLEQMKQPAKGLGSGEPANAIKNIWLIVGSEGGFSNAEVARLQNQGLEPVTLGSQILRVETACIALVSALKYEFNLMV